MEKEILERKIKTPNFILEPITSHHAASLYEGLQDKDIYRYIPTEPPKTLENLISKFKHWEKRFSPDKKEIWLNYAIYDEKNREYLGTLQATLIENGNNYVAYEVLPKFWRRGIATEVMSKFVEFLFSYWDINSLKAHIDTRNTASINLIRKLHFKQIEFLPNADFFKENNSDEFVFELDRQNWHQINKNSL